MNRGRYAGPVGWVDSRGDDELGLALRCAHAGRSGTAVRRRWRGGRLRPGHRGRRERRREAGRGAAPPSKAAWSPSRAHQTTLARPPSRNRPGFSASPCRTAARVAACPPRRLPRLAGTSTTRNASAGVPAAQLAQLRPPSETSRCPSPNDVQKSGPAEPGAGVPRTPARGNGRVLRRTLFEQREDPATDVVEDHQGEVQAAARRGRAPSRVSVVQQREVAEQCEPGPTAICLVGQRRAGRRGHRAVDAGHTPVGEHRQPRARTGGQRDVAYRVGRTEGEQRAVREGGDQLNRQPQPDRRRRRRRAPIERADRKPCPIGDHPALAPARGLAQRRRHPDRAHTRPRAARRPSGPPCLPPRRPPPTVLHGRPGHRAVQRRDARAAATCSGRAVTGRPHQRPHRRAWSVRGEQCTGHSGEPGSAITGAPPARRPGAGRPAGHSLRWAPNRRSPASAPRGPGPAVAAPALSSPSATGNEEPGPPGAVARRPASGSGQSPAVTAHLIGHQRLG